MMPGQSLIGGTLSRALVSMWEFYWPVLLPLFIIAGIAFVAYIVRTFTNVG